MRAVLDDRGQWSRTGGIDVGLLKRCCADNYFSLPAPKSTGPEYFNVGWLTPLLGGHESPADVQATLRALTSRTISGAVSQHLPGTERIYLCGGGVKNDALMEELRMDFDGLTRRQHRCRWDGPSVGGGLRFRLAGAPAAHAAAGQYSGGYRCDSPGGTRRALSPLTFRSQKRRRSHRWCSHSGCLPRIGCPSGHQ